MARQIIYRIGCISNIVPGLSGRKGELSAVYELLHAALSGTSNSWVDSKKQ